VKELLKNEGLNINQVLGYEVKEELKKCEVCGELVPEDYIIDTEGMINGGIGMVCEQCCEDGDIISW